MGLPPEERSKAFAVDDRKSQFKQGEQMRRAVRRHRERVVLQGDTETNVETVAPATVCPKVQRAAPAITRERDDAKGWENARQRLHDDAPRKKARPAGNRQRVGSRQGNKAGR